MESFGVGTFVPFNTHLQVQSLTKFVLSLPEVSDLEVKSDRLHWLTVPSLVLRPSARGWAFSAWQERVGFKFDRDKLHEKRGISAFQMLITRGGTERGPGDS